METSNFARRGSHPCAIAISRGVPHFYSGRRFIDLAPDRNMMKMEKEEFRLAYIEKLKKLNAKEVWAKLKETDILLCWESPNVRCHRRLVAEWFEEKLGVTVSESDYERKEIMSYYDSPRKGEKVVKIKEDNVIEKKQEMFSFEELKPIKKVFSSIKEIPIF